QAAVCSRRSRSRRARSGWRRERGDVSLVDVVPDGGRVRFPNASGIDAEDRLWRAFSPAERSRIFKADEARISTITIQTRPATADATTGRTHTASTPLDLP